MEQNNSISIPVIPGMRQDLEPHTAPPGTITYAQNVRFPAGGSVQSRRGLAGLTSAAPSAAATYSNLLDTTRGPDFMHPCQGGFLFGAKGFGFRYSDTKGVQVAGSYSIAQPRGVLETLAREDLYTSSENNRTPWPLSTAVNNGVVAICYAVGNGQVISTGGGVTAGPMNDVDAVTSAGAIVRIMTEDGALLSTGSWDDMQTAMVVADGLNTSLYVVYQNGTDLRIRTITTTGQVGSSSSIGTLSTATCFYAACEWPGIGVAVIYQSAIGTLTVKRLAAGAVDATQAFSITMGNGAPVSCYADTTNLYVGWAKRTGASSNDSEMRVMSTALATTAGPTTLYMLGSSNFYLGPPLFGPSAVSGSILALVAHATLLPGEQFTRPFEVVTATGVATAGTDQLYTLPLSAPFANGLWWARLAVDESSFDGPQLVRAALMDYQDERAGSALLTTAERLAAAKVALVGQSFLHVNENPGIENVYLQHMHTPAQLSSGEWVMGIPRVVRGEYVYSDKGYLMLCEWLRFTTYGEQQSCSVRDDVVVTGNPAVVDYANGNYTYSTGSGTYTPQSYGLDLGMLLMPDLTVVSDAGPGGLVAGSTYQYRAVIEYIDSHGRRHRSTPSTVQSVTVAVGESAAFVTVAFNASWLRVYNLLPSGNAVVVHLYRTVAGGSDFRRCTPPQGAPAAALTSTFTDLIGDGVLATREFLYTDGGVLGNDHPPSCRFITATEDRVWLAGLWDPTQAQSSKLVVPGEPVQFSDLDSFKVVVPDPVTGIASQDGLVILFAKSAIYVVQGLGPNDQGQGAWDTPRCITRSTGCVDWRSIVATSIGVFYQSERGIMLLPRGAGEPQFIGAPIQDLLEDFGRTITGSACCITSDAASVRFCTGTGTIIYDLETQAWSFDLPPASGGVVHAKICDTDAGPTYGRLAVDAGLGFDQEQDGLTSDTLAPISSVVEWAPIHPQKLAGWATFTGAISVFGKLAAASYPAAQLTVACNVDADTSNFKTKASMADMGDPDYRRLSLKNKRQGSSASLSFTTYAAPWRFIGWTVEMEPLDGTRNVQTALVY